MAVHGWIKMGSVKWFVSILDTETLPEVKRAPVFHSLQEVVDLIGLIPRIPQPQAEFGRNQFSK
jgi:hypothetical protein